jgi:hypothetical protein
MRFPNVLARRSISDGLLRRESKPTFLALCNTAETIRSLPHGKLAKTVLNDLADVGERALTCDICK